MLKRTILAGALALAAGTALAQEVKVGLVVPYTGVGAELGQAIDRGTELYLKLNAAAVRPYKITPRRDVGGRLISARSELRITSFSFIWFRV